MLIGVGINENVILTGAKIEDKGALILTFDNVENVGKTKANVFDAMQSATVEQDVKGFDIRIFPFKFPDGQKNETKTIDEKIEMLSDDMTKTKNQLTQLLEQYLTSENIKWDPYYNTGITGENYRDRFQDNDALLKVFNNVASQFIKMVEPFLGKPEHKLRIKLIRQSAVKHFATIPGRFLKDNPWVDMMEVPSKDSKVKFTKWEIDNGYDNGTPVPKAAADNTMAPPETAPSEAVTTNVFGQRT